MNFRNNSTKDLESFAETAISINRMMQQHLIISGPQFFVNQADKVSEESSGDDDEAQSDTDLDSALCFDFSSGIKLSPPGLSDLAKRRATTTHASANYNHNCKNSQHHPLISRCGSAMGSVESFCISSGSWQ